MVWLRQGGSVGQRCMSDVLTYRSPARVGRSQSRVKARLWEAALSNAHIKVKGWERNQREWTE